MTDSPRWSPSSPASELPAVLEPAAPERPSGVGAPLDGVAVDGVPVDGVAAPHLDDLLPAQAGVRPARIRRPARARAGEPNSAYPDTSFGLARYAGQVQTAAGLTLIAALWLVVSPWVLGRQAATVPTVNQVAVGCVLGVSALLRVMAPVRLQQLAWVDFGLGLWTICASFLLGYPAAVDPLPMLWNGILTGTLVLVLAAWSATARDAYLTGQPRRA